MAGGKETRRFGPYAVRRELARGGMGAVYEAVHEQTGGRYALKTLLPALAAESGGEAAQRFRREAEVLTRLEHPHLVRVLSAELEGKRPYMVEELLPGGTLLERVEQGPLSTRDAVDTARKLALALGHAHANGVLHRDLKPENVLFDAEGEPRLVDFGLAQDVQDAMRMTASDQVMGTPTYMAPEQVEGGRKTDDRTDVYGLGGILYAMLTGRAPFEGHDPFAVLKAVIHLEPTPPTQLNPEVPASVESVCLRALAKDPQARYRSMAAFEAALEQALLPPQPAGTRVLVAWVALIGLLLVAGALGFALWRHLQGS